MARSRHVACALGCAVALLGCHGPPTLDVTPPEDASVDAVKDATIDSDGCASGATPREIDIVLVVDNAGSGVVANRVGSAFGSFIDGLTCSLGARPNLQIAVISADMGAGSFNIPNCSSSGDGLFVSEPQVAGCSPAPGGVIVDRDGPAGPQTNYDGSLPEAVSCLASLGTNGCGFSQPLAALERAFDGTHVAQQTFIRTGADLFVLFVAENADCSAADPQLFDPALAGTLGALDPFRCFEFGVECTPDDPRTPGVKSSCQSRESSALLSPTGAIATAIAGLKTSADQVAVFGVVGSPDSVEVEIGAGMQPGLKAACSGSDVTAAPAVRLRHFAAGFSRFALADACTDDMAATLATLAQTAPSNP